MWLKGKLCYTPDFGIGIPFFPDVNKASAIDTAKWHQAVAVHSVFACMPVGHCLLLQTDPTS